MRVKLVLAAILASLVTGQAGAQIGPVRNDSPPPSAGEVSARVVPAGATSPAAVVPGGVTPAAGTASSEFTPAATVRPAARARVYRPRAVRWVRRRPARPPAPKLGPLTLPSFDMTAPFTLDGEKLLVVPRDDGSRDAGPHSGVRPGRGTDIGAARRSYRCTPTALARHPSQCPRLQTRGFQPQMHQGWRTHQDRRPGRPNRRWPRGSRHQPIPGSSRLPVRRSPRSCCRRVPTLAWPRSARVRRFWSSSIHRSISGRRPVGLDPAFSQLSSRRTEDATVIHIPMRIGDAQHGA